MKNLECMEFTKEFSHEMAYMATQYDDLEHSDEQAIENAIYDELIEKKNDDEIMSEYCDFLTENGDESYMTEDEVFDFIESLPPIEAFRLGQFSDRIYSDLYDFYKFDGYGNIQGFTTAKVVREARSDSDFKKFMFEQIEDAVPVEWMDETMDEYIELLKKGY